MDTNIYRSIIAIEDEGTITRAAERCFVSQPALSQQIQMLEKKLNCRLFQKENGRMIPTPQGKIFLTSARRMILIEDETENRIRQLKL